MYMDQKEYQAEYHRKKKEDPEYVARRKASQAAWYARNRQDPEFVNKQRADNRESRLKFRDDRNQRCKDWYNAHKDDQVFKAKNNKRSTEWLLEKLKDPEFKQKEAERHKEFLETYKIENNTTYAQAYYAKHKDDPGFKEKRIAWQKQDRQKNKERFVLKSRKEKLREYNLTLEDYDALLKAQNYVCALCFKPETVLDGKTGKVKALSVDHDHDTDTVRKLLCINCNMGLGSFKDNPELLLAAAEYLKQHKGLNK